MTGTIGFLIVDDEEIARQKLRELLADVADLRALGEAPDGLSAVQLIDTLLPDLVFLDIRLPGLSGLQVLERARHCPAVIFTTAFDQFAVAAFELQAIDYLLKPFSASRLRVAIERARNAFASRGTVRERAAVALGGRVPRQVFVRDRGTLLALPLNTVERIEGCDDFSALYANGRRYLLYRRLNDLETVLASANFVRVHRSHIVNIACIVALRPLEGGRMRVELRSGESIVASRARSGVLRDLAAAI